MIAVLPLMLLGNAIEGYSQLHHPGPVSHDYLLLEVLETAFAVVYSLTALSSRYALEYKARVPVLEVVPVAAPFLGIDLVRLAVAIAVLMHGKQNPSRSFQRFSLFLYAYLASVSVLIFSLIFTGTKLIDIMEVVWLVAQISRAVKLLPQLTVNIEHSVHGGRNLSRLVATAVVAAGLVSGKMLLVWYYIPVNYPSTAAVAAEAVLQASLFW